MLTPAATRAQHQCGEVRGQLGGRLQCLRCGHDFKPGETRSGLDSAEGGRPLFQSTGTGPAPDLLAFQGRWLRGWECGGGPAGRKEWGPAFCPEEK